MAISAAAITVYGCGNSSPPDFEPLGHGHVKVIQVGAVGYFEGTVSKATMVARTTPLRRGRASAFRAATRSSSIEV
jgi:hypothetical protein